MAGSKAFNFQTSASAELQSCLLDKGTVMHCDPGTVLIEEGRVSDRVILLLEGEVTITTTDHQGNQQRLAVLHDGAMVGEMSWLGGKPVPMLSATPCKVLELDVAVLDELSQSEPAIAAEWPSSPKTRHQIQSLADPH